MEREICSNPGSPGAPDRQPAVRLIDGRAADRHRWAVAALLVPLLFCAIVGLGVYLMFHRDMGYFKPAPSGSMAPTAAPPALASFWSPALGA